MKLNEFIRMSVTPAETKKYTNYRCQRLALVKHVTRTYNQHKSIHVPPPLVVRIYRARRLRCRLGRLDTKAIE